jgi:predicted MFS family arabinose efflux permease
MEDVPDPQPAPASPTATANACSGRLQLRGLWGITPAQQHRLIREGGPARIILSLNASALYTGVAIGAAVGGAMIAAGRSVTALCAIAAALELAAGVVLAITARLPANIRDAK